MRDGNNPTTGGDTSAVAGDAAEALASRQAATPEEPARVGEPGEVTIEGLDESAAPEAPEPASVHVIVTEDRTRIVVSGEIDADLAPDLQEASADAEATGLPIEVDAQHVTFMDSSGIAFLARLAARSAEKVRVLHAPENVRFLLDVTRIGELLDVVDEPAVPTIPRPTPPDVVA